MNTEGMLISFSLSSVFNSEGKESLIPMATTEDKEKLINIPSVFIGWTSGEYLRLHYLYKERNTTEVAITGDPGICLKCYIIPFLAVIGSSLLVLLVFVGVRVGRDRRRRRRNRLSRQRLKQLPTKQFQKGDEYDVCAICLDDYEEGDTLRILPCNHAYHCQCVDPWLTNTKRVCPLCKRRVLSDDESSSDSDYESDGEDRPLLRSDSASSVASTPRQNRSQMLTYGTGPSNAPPPPVLHSAPAAMSSSQYSTSSEEYQPNESYQNSYSGSSSSILSSSSSSSSITVLEDANPSNTDIHATTSVFIPSTPDAVDEVVSTLYDQRLPMAVPNEAYVTDEVEAFEVDSSTSQDIIVLVKGDEPHDNEFESNA
jgi:hypothetical protein